MVDFTELEKIFDAVTAVAQALRKRLQDGEPSPLKVRCPAHRGRDSYITAYLADGKFRMACEEKHCHYHLME